MTANARLATASTKPNRAFEYPAPVLSRFTPNLLYNHNNNLNRVFQTDLYTPVATNTTIYEMTYKEPEKE
jgi:hypothetical protein